MEEKEKQTVDTSPVDVDVGTAADVEEVMKKYDRESNTKIWEGLPKEIIRYAMAAFMIFMVYVSMFSSMDGSVRRCWFLGLILVFVYVMYPVKKGTVTRVNYMPWYDVVLAALSIGTFGYQIYFLDELVYKGSRLDTLDIIIGTLAILLLIEACRRVVGIPIIVVVVVFMCYALLGSGMEFKDLVYTLFYTGQGILGTPIQVCSTYIFLFVLFGAFLEATGIAARLAEINAERQQTELEVFNAARQALEADPARLRDRVLVVAGEDWHPGVVGIVAARLMERYGRPAIVISLHEGEGRGSGRAPDGFDLHGALAGCAAHLIRFGGHAAAAGVEMEEEKLPVFRQAVNEWAARHMPSPGPAVLELDAVATLSDLTLPQVQELDRLAPFGRENPTPVLLVQDAVIDGVWAMGAEGRHTRIRLRQGEDTLFASVFGTAPAAFAYPVGTRVEAALQVSVFVGRSGPMVSAHLRAIRPAGLGNTPSAQAAWFEAFCAGVVLEPARARALLPDVEHKSLTALCCHFGISQERAHRAVDDACAAMELYRRLVREFLESPQEFFEPKPLVYKAKKQGPMTPAQKGYLNDLIKYHKIALDVSIDTLTKNEASRLIDKIISTHGRIVR